jgi:hypothetical protein
MVQCRQTKQPGGQHQVTGAHWRTDSSALRIELDRLEAIMLILQLPQQLLSAPRAKRYPSEVK